jgi:hypothetical protein
MSHAIASDVDRAADAIVALINSRPSSPSKDEIAAIIARVAIGAFAPTELGRALLRFIPPFVAALAKADEEAAPTGYIDRGSKIIDAILARPVASIAHLVDLAIVARFSSLDERYGADEVLEDDEAAYVTMVRFLLQAAGIPEAACSINNRE